MTRRKFCFFGATLTAAAAAGMIFAGTGAQRASAQATVTERQYFQRLLLVPPDDKDYVVTRIPEGQRAVVTDLIVYNTADGKGHKVAPTAESYLWVGGYVEGKSSGLVNRMRVLGNDTEKWNLVTGLELRGAPELLVSSEKGVPSETSALVYVNGYISR
jgi:hypothetical protein